MSDPLVVGIGGSWKEKCLCLDLFDLRDGNIVRKIRNEGEASRNQVLCSLDGDGLFSTATSSSISTNVEIWKIQDTSSTVVRSIPTGVSEFVGLSLLKYNRKFQVLLSCSKPRSQREHVPPFDRKKASSEIDLPEDIGKREMESVLSFLENEYEQNALKFSSEIRIWKSMCFDSMPIELRHKAVVEATPYSVEFLHDSVIAVGVVDKEVEVWDISQSKRVSKFNACEGTCAVHLMQFDPSQKVLFLAATKDTGVMRNMMLRLPEMECATRIYDMRIGGGHKLVSTMQNPSGYELRCFQKLENELYGGDWNGNIHAFDVRKPNKHLWLTKAHPRGNGVCSILDFQVVKTDNKVRILSVARDSSNSKVRTFEVVGGRKNPLKLVKEHVLKDYTLNRVQSISFERSEWKTHLEEEEGRKELVKKVVQKVLTVKLKNSAVVSIPIVFLA